MNKDTITQWLFYQLDFAKKEDTVVLVKEPLAINGEDYIPVRLYKGSLYSGICSPEFFIPVVIPRKSKR